MCILLNVKKHEKTFALNVDIFKIIAGYKNYINRLQYWQGMVQYMSILILLIR